MKPQSILGLILGLNRHQTPILYADSSNNIIKEQVLMQNVLKQIFAKHYRQMVFCFTNLILWCNIQVLLKTSNRKALLQ